jgi:hypothetical protein
MVRALVGDSTMTSARFPPRRAGRLAGGALAAGAGSALGFAALSFGATLVPALGTALARAALRAGALDFGAAAFDPFAFGLGDADVLDFFGLLLAIGPDLDQAVSSVRTRKIASN